MKKILLASLTMFTLGQAQAQKLNGIDVGYNPKFKVAGQHENLAKKSRGGSTYLSQIFSLSVLEGISQTQLDANSSVYQLFPDSNVRYNAPDNAFGITWQSFGQVFDPASFLFQNTAAAGEIVITPADAYTIDTLIVPLSYIKVNAGIDTLVISLLHSGGTNLPTSFFDAMLANYNVDTTYFLTQDYNTLDWNKGAYQIAQGGPANTIIKYIFKNTDSSAHAAGTNSYGLKNIRIPVNNFAIPAGEKLGVTMTFKPGATWVAGDTVGKFNQCLFLSYEPKGPDTYGYYYSNDRNVSSVVTKNTSNGWLGTYIPSLAFTNTYGAEVHDITYAVSCATCAVLKTTDLTNLASINTFPNPANGSINFEIASKKSTSNATIDITTILGVKVGEIAVGKLTNNEIKNVRYNTSNLASGMYIYTLNADGQKQTGKFNVQ